MIFSSRSFFTLPHSWIWGADKIIHPFRTVRDIETSALSTRPATVPGNLELDLQQADLIGDPFFGLNIAELAKWEHHHVWYGCRFTPPQHPGKEAWLLFEGLDCYAEIYLNGKRIGETDNALIEHEFPVQDLLQEGENELLVHILPALDEAEKYTYPPLLGAAPCNYESLYIRKPPHSFGWDIMPRTIGGGIWRPVSLVFKSPSRIEDVFLRTVQADSRNARLILHYQVLLEDREGVHEVEIEGTCGDSRFGQRRRVLFAAGRIAFEVPHPERWWPRGRGKQSLYQITVRLLKNGEEIDRTEWMHGIRTIELDRSSTTDSTGKGRFCFRVNGEPFFVLGTNWVPADAFHSRDADRIPKILELAEECGCNMLRCWGGNVYESNDFFDLCDKKGFLVWQDFAFGCAVYPQDESFQKRVEKEARQVVRRLRRHASLALWAGDNECDQAHAWYNSGEPNANVLTRHTLPGVVREEDPGREYLPSSPYIDEEAFLAGETFLPENHLWGPRDGFKSAYYKESLCHFASEIGYHGCPSPSSVRQFISADNLWPPNNKEWLLHATSPITDVDLYDYRIELMQKQIREFFGKCPDNLEDFTFQSQCVQAEAFKFFIESFRTAKWRRTGIIWWNLCDGWPQFSDAIVDYYFSKKLAFDFITRSQNPLCLALREPENWKHDLVACNDTREVRKVNYKVHHIETEEVLCEGHSEVAADAVTVLESLPASATRQDFLLIEWESEGQKGQNHYLTGTPPYSPAQYACWLQKAFGLSMPV